MKRMLLMMMMILLQGGAITISGLAGTSEDDNQNLELVGTVGGAPFADGGVFSNNLGTLVFTLDFDVPVGIPFVFAFSLKNPASEQVPESPSVELQLLNESPPILIPAQLAAKAAGARCCLSSFDRPRFITATVSHEKTLIS